MSNKGKGVLGRLTAAAIKSQDPAKMTQLLAKLKKGTLPGWLGYKKQLERAIADTTASTWGMGHQLVGREDQSPYGGFSTQQFVSRENVLADPAPIATKQRAQTTSSQQAQTQASPAATRMAQKARGGQGAKTKTKSAFAVKRSSRLIPNENKVDERYMKEITRPTHENDIYAKHLRQLVANARRTAIRNAKTGKGLKFVPILNPRTNQMLVITASGQSLAYNMNDQRHFMEVASMAGHAKMTLAQLVGWADSYSSGLNNLDKVPDYKMEIPDASFVPDRKADLGAVIKRMNTKHKGADQPVAPTTAPVTAPAQPEGLFLPEVPQVHPI